jgi:hypothetical protein
MIEKFQAWWEAHPVLRDSILAGVAVVVGYLGSSQTEQPLGVVALVYMFVRAAVGYYLARRAA